MCIRDRPEKKDDFNFAFTTVFHCAVATFPEWYLHFAGPENESMFTKHDKPDASWLPFALVIGALACLPINMVFSLTNSNIALFVFMF